MKEENGSRNFCRYMNSQTYHQTLNNFIRKKNQRNKKTNRKNQKTKNNNQKEREKRMIFKNS